MSGWPEVPLAECLRPAGETVPVRADGSYPNVGMYSFGRGLFRKPPILGMNSSATALTRVRRGQFIYSRLFAFEGAYGVVDDAFDGHFVSNEYPVFDIDTTRLLPGFLRLHVSRPAVWAALAQGSKGVGVRRQRVQPDQVLAHGIPLPPLAEQQRIVGRIDEISASVATGLKLSEKSLSESAVLARASRDQAYARMAARHAVVPVESLCRSITDGDHNTPPFSDSGVPFIFVGNVSAGKLHFAGAKRVTTDYFAGLRSPRVPERGDVLFSAVGATLGIPAVVDTDDRFCFQRHIAILKPQRDRLSPHFLWNMLMSQTCFAAAWGRTTGSAQPTIPLHAIRALAIPAPPLAEQLAVVAELGELQLEIDALARHQAQVRAELDALLPAILDRAFAGAL